MYSLYDTQTVKAFQKIWKWKGIIPRVTLFIWRALQGGLATTHELSRRMRKFSAMCPRCGQESEYIMHMLFFCPISRLTWFMSQLALRVGALPLNFVETILIIIDSLQEEQIVIFCNIMWELWKARNEEVIAGKKATPTVILKKVMAMQAGIQNQVNPQQQENLNLKEYLWEQG